MNRIRSLVATACLALCCGVLARAESVIAVPTPGQLAPSGGELTLAVSIDYGTTPGALGLSIDLPEGWSFAGVVPSESAPGIVSGKGATGKAEMAWTTAPAGGAEFELKLNYPAGASAEPLTGTAQLRRAGKRLDLALTVPLGE